MALAEYNALRAEVISHITAQAAVVGLGLTALGVVAGFVAKDGGDQHLLLAIPPLTMLVVLLHAAGTYRVALIGDYIGKTLWPYLAAQVGQRGRLPSWEDKRAERNLKTASAVARGLFIDFPAMTLFIAASIFALYRLHQFGADGRLWWMGCLMTLIAIAVPIAVALLVRKKDRA